MIHSRVHEQAKQANPADDLFLSGRGNAWLGTTVTTHDLKWKNKF